VHDIGLTTRRRTWVGSVVVSPVSVVIVELVHPGEVGYVIVHVDSAAQSWVRAA
jgi:hypothetical protein